MTDLINRFAELDSLYTRFRLVAGLTVENTLDLFLAGYTLKGPDHTDVSDLNGCKYCMDGDAIALDMCNDGIAIETDGKLHMLSGGDWEVEINYCPICGRKLHD